MAQSMASDVVLRSVVKTWAELSQWFAQFCMATFIDATRNLSSDLLGTFKSKTAEFKSPWESHLGTFVCWQVCSRNSQTHLQDDKQISQTSGKIQYHAMSWQKATGSWRSYISYQARQEYQHPQPHSPPLSRELPESSLMMAQGCAGSQGNEIKKKKKSKSSHHLLSTDTHHFVELLTYAMWLLSRDRFMRSLLFSPPYRLEHWCWEK